MPLAPVLVARCSNFLLWKSTYSGCRVRKRVGLCITNIVRTRPQRSGRRLSDH